MNSTFLPDLLQCGSSYRYPFAGQIRVSISQEMHNSLLNTRSSTDDNQSVNFVNVFSTDIDEAV